MSSAFALISLLFFVLVLGQATIVTWRKGNVCQRDEQTDKRQVLLWIFGAMAFSVFVVAATSLSLFFAPLFFLLALPLSSLLVFVLTRLMWKMSFYA